MKIIFLLYLYVLAIYWLYWIDQNDTYTSIIQLVVILWYLGRNIKQNYTNHHLVWLLLYYNSATHILISAVLKPVLYQGVNINN